MAVVTVWYAPEAMQGKRKKAKKIPPNHPANSTAKHPHNLTATQNEHEHNKQQLIFMRAEACRKTNICEPKPAGKQTYASRSLQNQTLLRACRPACEPVGLQLLKYATRPPTQPNQPKKASA
jgi:hypothetical protein